MKCPRCQTVNAVFTFQAEKQDRCGRCSNYSPQIIRCKHCDTTWCPPCWKLAIEPPAAKPQKPKHGIGDESFDI